MFGLRQFDLVFVLKDYSKNVVPINSIPVEALETLQEWLTKVEQFILFSCFFSQDYFFFFFFFFFFFSSQMFCSI